MSIRILCPQGCKLRVPDRRNGTAIRCPKCRARIQLPNLDLDERGASDQLHSAELVELPKDDVKDMSWRERAGISEPPVKQIPPPQPPPKSRPPKFSPTHHSADQPIHAELVDRPKSVEAARNAIGQSAPTKDSNQTKNNTDLPSTPQADESAGVGISRESIPLPKRETATPIKPPIPASASDGDTQPMPVVVPMPPIEATPIGDSRPNAAAKDSAANEQTSTSANANDEESNGRETIASGNGKNGRNDAVVATLSSPKMLQRTLPAPAMLPVSQQATEREETPITPEPVESSESREDDLNQPTVGMTPDPSKQLTARSISFVIVLAGLFTMGPSLYHLFMWYKEGAVGDVDRWIFVLIFFAGLHFLYATYVSQLPDWSSVWVVSFLMLFLTCLDSLSLAGLFVGSADGPVARALQISESMRSQAMIWILCLVSMHGLLCYFCGREAMRWKRTFDIYTTLIDDA